MQPKSNCCAGWQSKGGKRQPSIRLPPSPFPTALLHRQNHPSLRAPSCAPRASSRGQRQRLPARQNLPHLRQPSLANRDNVSRGQKQLGAIKANDAVQVHQIPLMAADERRAQLPLYVGKCRVRFQLNAIGAGHTHLTANAFYASDFIGMQNVQRPVAAQRQGRGLGGGAKPGRLI